MSNKTKKRHATLKELRRKIEESLQYVYYMKPALAKKRAVELAHSMKS